MPIFDFAPEPATIITTVTPLGNPPFTVTFTEYPGAAPSGAILFPFLSFFPDAPDNGCDPDGRGMPQGQGPEGFGAPGEGKQGGPGGGPCRTSAAPTTNGPTSTRPPLSSTQSTPESTELTSSQSARESASTPTSAETTQGGSTTTSSYTSSTSTHSVVTSDPRLPGSNPSAPSTTIPTPTQPSSTTAAAQDKAGGLSAGSAVGIALGVLAGASILIAAGLFLFLRERKRRRRRGSMTRKLRPGSEGGSRSRALSSTWSWLGSLATGSYPADPEYEYERRTSQHPHDSDDPFPFHGLGMGSEKSATRADPTTPAAGEHGARGVTIPEVFLPFVTASLARGGCSIWDEFTSAAAATQATQPAGSVPNAPATSTAPSSTSPSIRSTATISRTLPSPPNTTPTEPASTKNGPSSPSRALPAVASSSETAAAIAHHSSTGTLASSRASALTSSPPPSAPPRSSTPPPPSASDPHQLNTGTLIAIALSALAVALALALVVFLLLRRLRRRSASGKWKPRMSAESARRRLEPHIYGGHSSHGRVSSVWTGFGSVSVDPAFDSESRRDLLRARSSFGSAGVVAPVAEKPDAESDADGGPARREGEAAYTPGASPCASLAPVEVEGNPLVQDASARRHRMHGELPSLPRLDARAENSRSELSEDPLPGTDCDCDIALPLDHHDGGLEPRASGLGRATRSSGEVRSVEAL
ncbi:hypothetical protein V8D89_000968 [Ganoderma adspersum]